MVAGIGIFVPFLVQWLAFTYNLYDDNIQQHPVGGLRQQNGGGRLFGKTHWNLLSEFNDYTDEDIEPFIPQLCSMVLDGGLHNNADITNYFLEAIESRCANSLPFGTKALNILEATLGSHEEQAAVRRSGWGGISGAQLSSRDSANGNSNSNDDSGLLRKLRSRLYRATTQGNSNQGHGRLQGVLQSDNGRSQDGIARQRLEYYKDFDFLLGALNRIGRELKSFLPEDRNIHLRNAISQCNFILFNRMTTTAQQKWLQQQEEEKVLLSPSVLPAVSSGSGENRGTAFPAVDSGGGSCLANEERVRNRAGLKSSEPAAPMVLESPKRVSGSKNIEFNIAQLSPSIARYSLHYPLQCSKCASNLRILRFVEQESIVLQSKERCPFLVVAEVLEENHASAADAAFALYTGEIYSSKKSKSAYGTEEGSSSSRQNVGTRLLSQAPSEESMDRNAHGVTSRSRSSVLSNSGTSRVSQQVDRQRPNASAESELRGTTPAAVQAIPTAADTPPSVSVHTAAGVRRRPLTSRWFRRGIAPGGGADTVAEDNISKDRKDSKDSNSAMNSIGSGIGIMPQTPISQSLVVASSVVSRQQYAPKENQNSEQHQQQQQQQQPQSQLAPWQAKHSVLQQRSPFGHLPGWSIKSFIVKTDDDMQKEVLSMQVLNYCQYLFSKYGVDIYLKPYQILLTGYQSGLVEFIEGALSIDRIKKQLWRYNKGSKGTGSASISLDPDAHRFSTGSGAGDSNLDTTTSATSTGSNRWKNYGNGEKRDEEPIGYNTAKNKKGSGGESILDMLPSSSSSSNNNNNNNNYKNNHNNAGTAMPGRGLKEHFLREFGPAYSPLYAKALDNFVRSLAGYSLVTYVLQVKDRHNANILIDSQGHLIHIDYGFALGASPGFNINFESAPFKLTSEYIDLLGGMSSPAYRKFEDLFLQGYSVLQQNVEGLATIVELFDTTTSGGDAMKEAADQLRSRLLFADTTKAVLGLVSESADNWRTKQYDWYQQHTNNIAM